MRKYKSLEIGDIEVKNPIMTEVLFKDGINKTGTAKSSRVNQNFPKQGGSEQVSKTQSGEL